MRDHIEMSSRRTELIDGKAHAGRLLESITAEVAELRANHNLQPGLAVVLVGEDPASQVYVRNKARTTVNAGMQSFEHKLPADTAQEALLALIMSLNENPEVHGILVQLPLPKQFNADAIIAAIDPEKDVDGLHVINAGRLATGLPGLVPCTPLGCLLLLRSVLPSLEGLNAVVVGRSNLVGKPIAQLLLQQNCTVTIAHSRTRALPALCQTADILIAAIGKPEFIRGEWIKPGATVIDVGINRVTNAEGRSRLVGDVAFMEVQGVAGKITPVPGGVGPMTIACLLRNTVTAAKNIRHIA